MDHVLAMAESGRHIDGSEFDPDPDEEEYFNECDHDFEDEIIGAVVTEVELSYEDDDYKWINHKDERFEDVVNMWCDCGDGRPMAREEAEGKARER